MRTHSLLPLLAVLTFCPPATAQHDHVVEAVVLVRFGSGDLVLNAPLLNALVNDPALAADMRTFGGEALPHFAVNIDLPAAHLAGTFQLHLRITVRAHAEWLTGARDKIVDIVVAHLRKRLDVLVYEQPMSQLAERREELSRRHSKLLHEHAALLARAASADVDNDAVNRLRDVIEQQSLAVRLDLATEQRANEHLEKARAEHVKARDSLREQRTALGDEAARIEIEMANVNQRIITAGPAEAASGQVPKLRDQVATLTQRLGGHRRQLQRLDEELADAHDLLARILEQLPASTLAMQRARARLDSLESERKALADQAEQAAAKRDAAAHLQAQAEQLQIDISVCRTLLTDIQGKLARLEPVRYELLRQG